MLRAQCSTRHTTVRARLPAHAEKYASTCWTKTLWRHDEMRVQTDTHHVKMRARLSTPQINLRAHVGQPHKISCEHAMRPHPYAPASTFFPAIRIGLRVQSYTLHLGLRAHPLAPTFVLRAHRSTGATWSASQRIPRRTCKLASTFGCTRHAKLRAHTIPTLATKCEHPCTYNTNVCEYGSF